MQKSAPAGCPPSEASVAWRFCLPFWHRLAALTSSGLEPSHRIQGFVEEALVSLGRYLQFQWHSLAVVLPFATSSKLNKLRNAEVCSLLGSIATVICTIALLFIWKGALIRMRSMFCVALRVRKKDWQTEGCDTEPLGRKGDNRGTEQRSASIGTRYASWLTISQFIFTRQGIKIQRSISL